MNDSSYTLITGARTGIGRALALKLLSEGQSVAVVSRDPSSLGDLNPTLTVQADPTDAAGVAHAFAACLEKFEGPPAYLAHCVGNTLIAPIHRTKADQWREVMRINLDSSFLVLSAWINALQTAGLKQGAAVFASSVVAQIGVANHEAIAAAKGGIEALVRSASATYAARGWRVNAVAPGMTETPMTERMLSNPAFREGAGRQYPLGGVQTAAEVAGVMHWLLGPGAGRVTGQIIPVDGGFTTIRPLAK